MLPADFETNPYGVRQRLTCEQQWATAISTNAGPNSTHHRCPLSVAAGGGAAWQQPLWQGCADAVIAAGAARNATLCRPSLLQPHSLHSDLAVLQHGTPCFVGRGVKGDTVTVTVEQDATADAVASQASAAVDPSGYWKACLTRPLAPSLANHTVRYKGEPSGSVAVNVGVLVGNVILCSGQSNSEHSNPHLGLL